MEEVVLKVEVTGSGDAAAKVKTIKQELKEAMGDGTSMPDFKEVNSPPPLTDTQDPTPARRDIVGMAMDDLTNDPDPMGNEHIIDIGGSTAKPEDMVKNPMTMDGKVE